LAYPLIVLWTDWSVFSGHSLAADPLPLYALPLIQLLGCNRCSAGVAHVVPLQAASLWVSAYPPC
jgi:hypothetical protein